MLAQSAGVQATWVRRSRRQGDLVQQRIRLFGRSRSAGSSADVAECKARACRGAGAQGRRLGAAGGAKKGNLGVIGVQARCSRGAGAQRGKCRRRVQGRSAQVTGRRLVRGK
ncbi:hypothetical protein SLEP1_g48028 [Rubroshorea leprosula]|uniref:Uncharacterized protein n=1 Tax=Rubroshorea leprosula TaxID=152421 RepID=A0AAV5LSC9_9ROSI|nr:hypothetical protein SLEP1_g48028 [Rubroshorea leprosula]